MSDITRSGCDACPPCPSCGGPQVHQSVFDPERCPKCSPPESRKENQVQVDSSTRTVLTCLDGVERTFVRLNSGIRPWVCLDGHVPTKAIPKEILQVGLMQPGSNDDIMKAASIAEPVSDEVSYITASEAPVRFDWDAWFASLPLIQRARSWANAAAATIGEARTRALAMAQTLRERLKTEELLSDPVTPTEAESTSAQAAYMDAINKGDSEAAAKATEEIVRERRSAAGVTRPEMTKQVVVDSFMGISGDARRLDQGGKFVTKKCSTCQGEFQTRSMSRTRCDECLGGRK